MVWLAAIIAIIATVFFAIAYPGFRKVLLVMFLALVAAVAAIIFFHQYESRQSEEKDKRARSLIKDSEVEFQNVILGQDYGSWKVKGLVKNNSRYQIEKISLIVAISNCDGSGKNCIVVGSDNDVSGYSLDIPPGQARALDAYVTFRNLPQLTDWNWTYRVGYIQAKQ